MATTPTSTKVKYGKLRTKYCKKTTIKAAQPKKYRIEEDCFEMHLKSLKIIVKI